MNAFSERLKELRREHGFSQRELAERIGTSKSSINMYERGEREPGFAVLTSLCELFGVDFDTLLGGVPRRGVPLLGEIACGKPIFAEEQNGGFFPSEPGIRTDFCLRAHGDSMIGARIADGDLVFIRRQSAVENGEIAAVVIEDTATLKRVYYDPRGEKLTLIAENPRYEPQVYVGNELDRIQILGKAVAFSGKL